jgi:hypothetical protein
MDYRGERYASEAYRWAQECFTLFVLNVWDAEWYRDGVYRTDRLVERLRRHYRGIDMVLLWNGYPRIGLDDRNQFSFWRDLDGGIPAIRNEIDVFHRHGVRCAIPFLPWDNGTVAPDEGAEAALCDLIGELDLDAVFLDTLAAGSEGLRRRVDTVKAGVVFVPERVPDLDTIDDYQISWLQGYREYERPCVLRNKVFEQRHMQWEVRRWPPHHDEELQRAWLNGTGTVVWENVFGTWVGTDRRFKTTLSLMRPVQKRFAELFSTGEWHPSIETGVPGLWASYWTDGAIRLWTFVNRHDRDVSGPVLSGAITEDAAVYDAIEGRSVAFERTNGSESTVTCAVTIAAGGIGCVVAAGEDRLGADWTRFLEEQARRYRRYRSTRRDASAPVGVAQRDGGTDDNAAGERVGRDTDYVAGSAVRRVTSGARGNAERDAGVGAEEGSDGDLPGSMVRLDPPPQTSISFSYRVRECHLLDSIDRFHWLDGKHTLRSAVYDGAMQPYEIGEYPVTNGEFTRFLSASGYVPKDRTRFLAQWSEELRSESIEDDPVTNVTLEDAWAYAEWCGARLPTVEEALYAVARESTARGATRASERSVAIPGGAAARYRAGDVWELSASEYTDDHTRFVLLTGGSSFRAEGAPWYFDGGRLPDDWIAKMIRFSPAIDRSDTVGFRIARTTVGNNTAER